MANEIAPRALFRYRLAGLLAGAGLVVQALTLLEEHPLTFILFILGGGSLVVAGLVVFVWAWITER